MSKKIKLLGNGEFNSLKHNSNISPHMWVQHVGFLTFLMEGKVETGIELKISYSNTMLNHWFSQKFMLLGNGEFNSLKHTSNGVNWSLSWYLIIKNNNQTSSNLLEKVAFSPFFFVFSFLSTGIKQALKAPGSDSNRDLSITNVRIWEVKQWVECSRHLLKNSS